MPRSADLPEARTRDIVVAASIVLLSVLPAIVLGFPPGHDAANHPVWLEGFYKQLAAGDSFPRWLMDANGGLGSPTFFFYGPLSFYLTSALMFVTGGVFGTGHILGLSCGIAGILSFAFAYRWLRGWVPARAALIGAVFYAVAPYHVFIDLYNRAAFGEYWAFVWPPLILWAADRLFEDRQAGLPLVAVSYSLLGFAHLPTMTLFSPLLAGYILWRGRHSLRAAMQGIVAMVLGAALTAVFLIPGYIEQRHIAVDVLRTGFYDYRNWFMFVSWLHPVKEMPDRWNWITLFTLIAGAACYGINRGREAADGLSRFFFYSIIALLFMMSPLSGFIWAALTPLKSVQFPVRWNSDLVLACSALVAFGFGAGSERNSNPKRLAFACTAACLIFSFAGIAVWNIEKRDTIRGRDELSRNISRDVQHRIDPYFVPIQAAAFRGSVNTESVARGMDSVLHGQQVVIRRDPVGPRGIRFAIQGGAGRSIKLPVFYYPNWIAANQAGQHYTVGVSQPDGLITVPLLTDNETVLLTFVRSGPERVGAEMSLGALAFVAVLFAVPLVRKRKRPAPDLAASAAAGSG